MNNLYTIFPLAGNSYNGLNQLTASNTHTYKYDAAADVIAKYKYDIHSHRIQKEVNGTTTNFFWEGDNLAYELDAAHNPIRRYLYGVGKDDVEGHIEYSEITGNVFDVSKKGWYTYLKDQVVTYRKSFARIWQDIFDVV